MPDYITQAELERKIGELKKNLFAYMEKTYEKKEEKVEIKKPIGFEEKIKSWTEKKPETTEQVLKEQFNLDL